MVDVPVIGEEARNEMDTVMARTRAITQGFRAEIDAFFQEIDTDLPKLPPFKEMTLPNKANETIYMFAESYTALAGIAVRLGMRKLTLGNMQRRLRFMVARNPNISALTKVLQDVEDLLQQVESLHLRTKEKLDYIDKNITTLKSIKNTICSST